VPDRQPFVDDAAFVLGGAVRAVVVFAVLLAVVEAVGSDGGVPGWGTALVVVLGTLPALLVAVPLGLLVERRVPGARTRVVSYGVLGALVPVVVGLALTAGRLGRYPGDVVALAVVGAVATPLAWWWSRAARRRALRRRWARGPSDEQVEDAAVESTLLGAA